MPHCCSNRAERIVSHYVSEITLILRGGQPGMRADSVPMVHIRVEGSFSFHSLRLAE